MTLTTLTTLNNSDDSDYSELGIKHFFILFDSMLISILGELIIGWLGDRPDVNLNVLYAICMIVCGGSTALVPFLSNYYALCTMAGLYGLCISGEFLF